MDIGLCSTRLIFSSEIPDLRLYHENCRELLDAIAAKHPAGRFDAIFAAPPEFRFSGGISFHAGVWQGGQWRLDKSRGTELNHEFNLEWLRRCQRGEARLIRCQSAAQGYSNQLLRVGATAAAQAS